MTDKREFQDHNSQKQTLVGDFSKGRRLRRGSEGESRSKSRIIRPRSVQYLRRLIREFADIQEHK